MSCPELPVEIIEKIFVTLSTSESHVCSRVCRRWRNVANRNPFLIPNVLRSIFYHLDLPSILEARLVCKLWRDTLNAFSLNSTISSLGLTSIRRPEAIANYCSQLQERNDPSSNPFPTRNLHLRIQFKFNRNSHYYHARLRNFYSIFSSAGHHLRFLTISIGRCSEVGTCFNYKVATSFIFAVVKHLPNLKGLTVHHTLGLCMCDYAEEKDASVCSEFVRILASYFSDKRDYQLPSLEVLSLHSATYQVFSELIQKSPNLELLDLSFPNQNSKPLFRHLGKNATPNCFKAREAYPLSNLSHLTLILYSTTFAKCTKGLTAKGSELRLKFLGIRIHVRNELKFQSCAKALRHLIVGFATTLETFDLFLLWQNCYVQLSLLDYIFSSSQLLLKLKVLRLNGCSGSIEFLTNLTNLEELYFVYENYDDLWKRQVTFTSEEVVRQHLPNLKRSVFVQNSHQRRKGERERQIVSSRTLLLEDKYRVSLWEEEQCPMLESDEGTFPYRTLRPAPTFCGVDYNEIPWCCGCILNKGGRLTDKPSRLPSCF